MFGFKSMVFRCIEVYENSPDDYIGYLQFFTGWAMSQIIYAEQKGKDLPMEIVERINKMCKLYMEETDHVQKNKLSIIITKTIHSMLKDIELFNDLKVIRSSEYVPELDFDVNRKKVIGCVGTVVEV